jgi:hypothetical protein
MAQLVAHSLWERGVVSSSLAAPTTSKKRSPLMKLLKNISFVFSLALAFTTLISSEQPQHSASFNLSEACAPLTLDELHFVANFCLMSHQYILIDRAFVHSYYQLAKTLYEVNAQAISASSSNTPAVALEQAYKDYFLMFRTRQLWQRRYAVFKQALENKHSTTLDTITTTLYLQANAYIDRCLEIIMPQLDVKLNALHDVFAESAQSLATLATTYQDLVNNKFPFDVQEHEVRYMKSAYIEQLTHAGLQQSYRMYEANDFILKEIDRVKQEFCNLFLTWYSTVYAGLTAQTTDQQYFTFLFNEELPAEGTKIDYIPAPPSQGATNS